MYFNPIANCQGRSKREPVRRSNREPVARNEGVFRGRRGAGAWRRRSSSPEARVEGQSGAFAAALFEAVGVGVHLQDVDMMGDAIEQGAGEPLGSEDLGPLVERQIAGNQG